MIGFLLATTVALTATTSAGGDVPPDVRDLVSRMTLEEKAAQYRDGAPAVCT